MSILAWYGSHKKLCLFLALLILCAAGFIVWQTESRKKEAAEKSAITLLTEKQLKNDQEMKSSDEWMKKQLNPAPVESTTPMPKY